MLFLFLEDFAYGIYFALTVFSVLHRINDGKTDYIVLPSVLLGMAAYHVLLGRFMVAILSDFFRKGFRYFKRSLHLEKWMDLEKWKNRLTAWIKKIMILLCKRAKDVCNKRKEFHEKERDCISKKEKE